MNKKLALFLLIFALMLSVFFTVAAAVEDEVETTQSEITTTEEAPHEHKYKLKSKTEPTCTEKGKEVYICECGDSYERTTRKLGHNYKKSKTVSPTLKAKGYTVYKCTRCGKETKKNYVAALKNINGAAVSNVKAEYTYKASSLKPNPVLKIGGSKLKKGRDYSLKFSNNKNKGKGKIIISGKGKFGGTKTVTFKIKAAEIKRAAITGFEKYKKYTGEQRCQRVKLSYKGKKLKKDRDYTIAYKNNTNLGSAQLIIKGKGNFFGEVSKKYSIVRKGWFTDGGNSYYYSKKGKKYTSGQYQIGKNFYYFNGDGIMQTGWKKIGDNYCLFNRSNGKKVFNKNVDGMTINESGNVVLTDWSRTKISVMMKAHSVMLNVTLPTDTMAEKRYKCFMWILSLPYRQYRKLNGIYKQAGWEFTLANDIFDRGQGCCVSQSSAAAFLFREIGYTDVYVCHDTGHSWLVIGDYLYDPVFAEAKSFSKNYNVLPYDYRKNPVGKRYIG